VIEPAAYEFVSRL